MLCTHYRVLKPKSLDVKLIYLLEMIDAVVANVAVAIFVLCIAFTCLSKVVATILYLFKFLF